jgi:hypothetical protein
LRTVVASLNRDTATMRKTAQAARRWVVPGLRTGGCGTLLDVLATVSFYYGHRDPVSVTAG